MDSKIVNSCAFLQFASQFADFYRADFVNHEGTPFMKLTFIKDDGTSVEVTNSSKWKVPTDEELYANAQTLAVYELESGNLKLAPSNLGKKMSLAKLLGKG
jgi:hypothetical protein